MKSSPPSASTAPRTSTVPTMPDPVEVQRILAFAELWHRFGGGSPEDIFVTFGVDRETFARRVVALLDSAAHSLDPIDIESIRRTYQ